MNKELKLKCVGTFFTPSRAITAAHCLTGSERSITIQCRDAHEKTRIEIGSISQQTQHPTHDVTILEFESPPQCDIDFAVIAPLIRENDTFFILPSHITPSDEGLRHPAQAFVVETGRNAYTIDVIDSHMCLSQGESGTPLFLKRNLRKNVIAGLLIAGSYDCPSWQTFVRLDSIWEWVAESLK